MATPPPSSPSSEITAKPHPYQQFDFETGPKGAFEARQLNNGLYVRVDMPGVPNNGVKVVKYNDTRTITFTGKAPSKWPELDSCHSRVYAGYVILDRDPSNVNFTTDVDEGVLRLFFPNCDGSLHFLSANQHNAAAVLASDDESGGDPRDNQVILAEDNISFILHSPLEPYGITLTGGKSSDINPHLLSGVRGVYEHKIVPTTEGHPLIYIRLDVPGTCNEGGGVIMRNSDGAVIFAGISAKDLSRFGEQARGYFGVLQPQCACCIYEVVKHDTTDGVMRFLVRKTDTIDTTPVCHFNMPPATPGGDQRPVRMKMYGDIPGETLSSRSL